jgi:hypothetical protein
MIAKFIRALNKQKIKLRVKPHKLYDYEVEKTTLERWWNKSSTHTNSQQKKIKSYEKKNNNKNW